MMNTILLSFTIVITLVNLALALSSFGYIVEMNKHMDEWFKMFKTLTEACSGLCEENGHVITSLMKHIEYTEKGLAVKEEEIQDLNDKYDKLYEEFRKLDDRTTDLDGYGIREVLKNIDNSYRKWIKDTRPEGDIALEIGPDGLPFIKFDAEENDDGLSSFWHKEEDEDEGGQND